MIDDFESLVRVTATNKELELSSLFDDDNGNDNHIRIVNIISYLRKVNKNKNQPLRFYFVSNLDELDGFIREILFEDNKRFTDNYYLSFMLRIHKNIESRLKSEYYLSDES